MKIQNSFLFFLCLLVILSNSASVLAANNNVAVTPIESSAPKRSNKYVAKNEGIQQFLNAITLENKKPYVVSQLAKKKTIAGDFDMSDSSALMDQLSSQYGLVWYDNGQTTYVYDNSELKSIVINLRNASLTNLTDFLNRAGLASSRYPIRAEQKKNAIFVSGPPAYVDVVTNAATYLDDLYSSTDPDMQGIDIAPPKGTAGYVAKNESIQFLFNALSSEARKPYILSKLAQKKTVTGDFDISNPTRFLDKISAQIGLAWYDDGQTIYVYDNSELKNAVVMLRSATLTTLNEFLQRTGLLSNRYPIRGEEKKQCVLYRRATRVCGYRSKCSSLFR